MDFHKIYKPITAAPFIFGKSHREIEPCEALKPYIRCFWGSENSYVEDKADKLVSKLLVPDTCMDVIFRINFTDNKLESYFCGVSDMPFFSDGGESADQTEKSVFGIRFYAWSVTLFTGESMRNVKNRFFDARQYFPELVKELEKILFDVVDLKQRTQITENILLQHLNDNYNNPLVMDTIGEILRKKGNLKLLELSKEIYVSERQIERLFKEYVGLSPKIFSSLIRYQFLWRDVFFDPNFQIQDEIFRYGYTDQSHLLRDFKRFHTINITQAKKHALGDVGFLQ